MARSGLRTAFAFSLCLLVVARASAAPEGEDAAFMSAAAAAVEAIEREDGFSGVILIARGDQVLLRKAAGFADYQRNVPNTPETRFPLLSVTKHFTAAAIMVLAQDGKVALSDPISKYYARSPDSWKEVTIRHLLTHGSGIRDYWVTHPELREPFLESIRSYEDLFEPVVSDPLGFAPGTGISYSNAGYALLTMVIERASGQRYADFLQTRVFGPLGMRATGVSADAGVRGYQGAWPNWVTTDYTPIAGAGGLYSTLDDMLTWSRALATDRVLTQPSHDAMVMDYGHAYGFGLRMQPKYGRKLIWHTGSAGVVGGYAAIFDYFPDNDLSVIAMTNNSGLIDYMATLIIEGKPVTFQANAARKAVEEVERLYFGRAP